jgi:hypothetical protein
LDTGHEGESWIAVRVSGDDACDAVVERLHQVTPAPSTVGVKSGRPEGAHTVDW